MVFGSYEVFDWLFCFQSLLASVAALSLGI